MKNMLMILIFAFLIANVNGCGGGGSSTDVPDKTRVTIDLGAGNPLRASSIPSSVADIRFEISAPDMENIERVISVEGRSSVSETFDVPNGIDRFFLIEAMDAAGRILYRGNGEEDLSGTPVSLVIAMRSTADITPPSVGSTTIADGATDVPINTSVIITFSEDMDASTLTTDTFILSYSGGTVTGTVTYDPGSRTATFTPSMPLAGNTTYTATITTGVKDLAGNPIASNYTWSFTTGTAPDVAPPTVSSTTPANGATGVAVSSAISATFSEVMNPSTINMATFTLSGGITGAVTYSGTTAVLTPSTPLSYNTTYTATVASGVKDLSGNPMANSYSWSFTTGSAPDTTPPTVSSTTPASGATGVAVNSAISATFSEAMEPSTMNTATFTLSGGVTGTVIYTGTTATFTPSANLAYSTTYTATITTGVKDLAGNPMANPYTWSFTTGGALDTTPPTVSSTTPANGATGVAVSSAISATFSEVMDPSTINTATFTLSGGVTGTITYTGTTATFTPSANLAYSTTYTATITTGVKDLAGNPMANPYTWSFATGSAAVPWTMAKQLGTADNDYAYSVAADDSGNIYVTGYTAGSLNGNTNAGGYDAFLVKYDSSGTRQWTRQIGTAYNDYAYGLATDGNGNIYMTGRTFGGLDGNANAGGWDIFLVKYDPSGVKQWTRQLGTADKDSAYNGIATDGSGNIYVTGYTSGGINGNTNAGGWDVFLVKYDPSGTRIWSRQFGTADDDYAYSVAVDGSENIYVAGYTSGGLDGNINMGFSDLFLVKYDPSGTKQWTRQLGTEKKDYAYGVATDGSGNILVTGRTFGGIDGNTNAGNYDVFLVKYDPTGTKQWTRQLGTTNKDYAHGVATDSSGNAYVTGRTEGGLDGNTSAGGSDIFLVKYDPAGTKLWARQLGTAYNDSAYGVATDGSGNAYVTGRTEGGLDGNTSAGGSDLFLVKYDTSGTKQ